MRDVVKSVIADYLKALVLNEFLPISTNHFLGIADSEKLDVWYVLTSHESSYELDIIYKVNKIIADNVIGSIELTNKDDICEHISFEASCNLLTKEVTIEVTSSFIESYNGFIAKEVMKQLIASDKEHLSYYLEKLIADNPTFSCEAFNLYMKIDDDDDEESVVTGIYLNLNYENDLTEMRIATKLNSSEAVSLIAESKESEDFVLPYWMQKLIFNYMFDFN